MQFGDGERENRFDPGPCAGPEEVLIEKWSRLVVEQESAISLRDILQNRKS
jgi:hypothetical protein